MCLICISLQSPTFRLRKYIVKGKVYYKRMEKPCQILRLKCTKIQFQLVLCSDPAGRAYSAPPDLLDGVKGPTSKGRGVERNRWDWMGVEGKRGEGRECCGVQKLS